MASEEGGGSDNSMGWVGAIGAAALGGLLSSKGQKETNEKNLEIAREQMAFQEKMSNSAYQRAIEDMKKAGINPMMVTQVGGASSPTGNMPQIQNELGAGVSGAQQALATYQAAKNAEQTAAQTEKIKSETMEKDMNVLQQRTEIANKRANTQKQTSEDDKIRQEVPKVMIEAASAKAQYDQMTKQGGFAADVAKRKAESYTAQAKNAEDTVYRDYYKSPVGKSEPYVKLGADAISSAGSAFRNFKRR